MNEIGYQPYSNQSPYINPSAGEKFGGILLGTLAASGVSLASLPVSKGFNKILNKYSDIITDAERTTIETAAKEALTKTGLAKKGVSIVNIPNFYEFLDYFENTSKNAQLLAPRFEKTLNAIRANDKKYILPIFGEIGHALNNHSVVGKALLGLSKIALPITSAISMISLFKTKKAPDEQPESKSDKITTFIKENSGKLIIAAGIPAILEKGVAMIKGNKLAKEFLSPELAKSAKKINLASFGVKILTTVISALSVVAAKNAKDAIVQKTSIYDEEYVDDYYQNEQDYYNQSYYYDEPYYNEPYYGNEEFKTYNNYQKRENFN